MQTEMTVLRNDNLVKNILVRPVSLLSAYYSNVLGRSVSVRQTLYLLNAQAAFALTVFADSALPLRVACAVWLVAAVMQCKKAL